MNTFIVTYKGCGDIANSVVVSHSGQCAIELVRTELRKRMLYDIAEGEMEYTEVNESVVLVLDEGRI